jgi:hypothetical protein
MFGFDVIARSEVTLTVIASEAKQSTARATVTMDCFVAEFIIGPAEGGTRWLLAMTVSNPIPLAMTTLAV